MDINGDFMRFVRFAMVGLLNTGIHIAAVYLLVEYLAVEPPLANAIAFLCANVFSYFMNSIWTFRARRELKVYLKFLTVSIVGLTISWTCVYCTRFLGINYMYGVVCSVFAVAVASYWLNSRFVFVESQTDPVR
jgi:putative flippase GtrA